MMDDGLPRSTETQYGGGPNVDSVAFANDVHDMLASRICGTRSGGEANSLGSHLVEYQSQECQGHV